MRLMIKRLYVILTLIVYGVSVEIFQETNKKSRIVTDGINTTGSAFYYTGQSLRIPTKLNAEIYSGRYLHRENGHGETGHGDTVATRHRIPKKQKQVEKEIDDDGNSIARKKIHACRVRDTIGCKRKRWPLQVPYTTNKLSSKLGNKVVREAIRDIEKKTCITFIMRTNEIDYMNFMDGAGCFSFIGKQGGKQDVILGNGCYTKPKAEHEIMHTLGSYHEQNRPDRDKFVRVLFKNIIPKFREQFIKRTRPPPLGKYDYGSIMHYGKWAFSSHKDPIMRPKLVHGKRYRGDFGVLSKNGGMTRLDAKSLNSFYGCEHLAARPGIVDLEVTRD